MKTLAAKQGGNMQNVFNSLARFGATVAVLMAAISFANAQVLYISGGASGLVSQVTTAGSPSLFVNLSPGNVQGITSGSTGNIFVATGTSINQVTPGGSSSLYASYANAIGGLTMSSSGTLYGVRMAGGPSGGHDVGTYLAGGSFVPLTLTTTPFAPFYSAQSVKFDNSGNIFVTNSGAGGVYANSVVKLTPSGGSWSISSFVTLSGGFQAFDVAFDSLDNVYVSSGAATSTINKYSSSGVLDAGFTVTGLPASSPLRGLAFSNGFLYATMLGGYNVYKINPSTGVASVFNTSALSDYRGTYLAFSAVPEPSVIALVLLGGLALARSRRHRKKS